MGLISWPRLAHFGIFPDLRRKTYVFLLRSGKNPKMGQIGERLDFFKFFFKIFNKNFGLNAKDEAGHGIGLNGSTFFSGFFQF